MNAMRNSLMTAMTVLALAATTMAAQAQDSQAKPQDQAHQEHHRPTPEMMQEKMGEFFAMQQARVHFQLKLTAAQEPAWNTYQAAIKPTMPAGARPDMKAWMAMPAPDRMARMIEMGKQHLATEESHLTALRAFYATLTPVQQKAFDHAMMGRHGHGHHGWGHDGGHGGEGEHGGWQQRG
ncbi:Spy/CpxP family protein refolding chaperone [Rugamonas sp.]|uniref:Spy/CpxP family protein refolding chaperone n=1 Tax=Rugamonas sp. TaxID=1926287 RepID=UPI0025D2741A|nr:Spy/CpxP family protein refolding chaperone [Rugamonas sp.]